MSFNVWWEVEKHVLYMSFSGDMSGEELYQAMQEAVEELKVNGGPFVNVITDVRNVKRQLPMPEMMKVVRRFKAPDQMGWSIMVGNTNPILRFLGNVAGQYLGQRMRNFDTPEEAIAFLRQYDPTIEWDGKDL